MWSSAAYNVLNQSDAQMEDGHAMVKFDKCPIIPELEPRSAWMSQNCQQMRANIKTCPVEKFFVDCEANLIGAVGSCRLTSWQKVPSDGSWAALSRVVSSLPPLSRSMFADETSHLRKYEITNVQRADNDEGVLYLGIRHTD